MRCTLKKTIELLSAQGNDYLVTVKRNQRKLYAQLQSLAVCERAIAIDRQSERIRGRDMTRTVSVFALPDWIKTTWEGAQHGIEVIRTGRRGQGAYAERHYYLTSLSSDALRLQQRIRAHWQIENRLHWVKDVVLGEDHSSIRAPRAATGMAFLRNLAITLFRRAGHDSITAAIDRFSNDLDQLLPMLDFHST